MAAVVMTTEKMAAVVIADEKCNGRRHTLAHN
jgi:hypothetical protein